MTLPAVLLDAGHGLNPQGGIDNGATGNNTTERDQVLAIARQLVSYLTQAGFTVHPIGIDERLSVPQKVEKANSLGTASDLLISIHMNAGPAAATGIEGIFPTQKPQGQALAQALVRGVADETGLSVRSPSTYPSSQDRLGHLGILDDTVPFGVLIECGFVTSAHDVAVIEQHTVAIGLLKGILAYLSLPFPMSFYLDIDANAWYRPDVEFCLQQGIFQMPTDGLFHPEQSLNRAEAAAMFARLLRSQQK